MRRHNTCPYKCHSEASENLSSVIRENLRNPRSIPSSIRVIREIRGKNSHQTKKDTEIDVLCEAERVGFEPTVTLTATTLFESAPISHSGTSPYN